MDDLKGYVVSHTHWDREWRYPVWENRLYLCEMMDELLDTLKDDSEYHSFLLDGQSVIISDYLAMRPERKHELLEMVRQRRLQIGPFYTLPDLYPISGESIVRNLLRGKRVCEKLGGWLDIGYESFGWGQPSQLPQIYRGFGIDTVIVSKNVDKSRAPHCEFVWEGKDGTRVLATRLGNDARANFYMNSYLEIVYSVPYHSSDYVYRMGGMGQIYHQAGEEGYTEDYFQMEDIQSLNSRLIPDAVGKSWANMDDSLLSEHRLLMCGSDSTAAQRHITGIIRQANNSSLGYTLEHTDLRRYVDLMKQQLNPQKLPLVTGELRDGPATALSANALMTRPHIKMLNKMVQRALFDKAEPFSIAGAMLGQRYETEFLHRGVEYMLLSHPHDSINGVTQDKTERDVLYRLEQALELGQVVYQNSCKYILSRLDYSQFSEEDILLVVFNPLPFERNEICKAFIDTPADRCIWSFSLEDTQGNSCPVRQISRQEKTIPVNDRNARPWPNYVDRHEIIFETGLVPAGGYKVYRLTDAKHFVRKTEFWAQTRKTAGGELATSSSTMENEHLCLSVNPNGTIRMVDKNNGRLYDNLNYYESTGDVGDYWIHYPPYHNRTYTTQGDSCDIWLEENTDLQATIGVKLIMNLPAYGYRPERYIQGESRRSDEIRELEITTRYTLRRGERMVRVRCDVENTCEDHRMSVVFDTGIPSEAAHAQGHFCVDARPAIPLRDEKGEYYPELCPQPMQDFVLVEEKSAGIAILQDCMCEYELRDNPKRSLSLTLLRAVRNIICTEHRSAGEFPHQKGGQILRQLSFNYAICPYGGDWQRDGIHEMSRLFNLPVSLAQTCKASGGSGTLPGSHSFYSVGKKLHMTALKKAEDRNSIVLRIFNPYNQPMAEQITMQGMISGAHELNLNEDRLCPLEHREHEITLCVQPHKIVTVEIELKEEIWTGDMD